MFLFYYESLNDSDKKIYNLIRNAVDNTDRCAEIRTVISSDKIVEILQYVLYDSPSLFYIKSEKINITSTVIRKKIWFDYLYDNKEILLYKERILNRAKWIVSKLRKNNQYDCIKKVYQYFVSNCSYVNKDYFSYTIVGALLDEEAVCQGYAYAFKYILDLIKIKCVVVSGSLNGVNHAWNIVWLENQAYHIDVTAGIIMCEGIGLSYDFMLVHDDIMRGSYTWDEKLLPRCDSIKFNYYVVEGLIVRTYLDIVNVLSEFKESKSISFRLDGEIKREFDKNEDYSMRHVIDVIIGYYNTGIEVNYLYQNTVLHLTIKKR